MRPTVLEQLAYNAPMLWEVTTSTVEETPPSVPAKLPDTLGAIVPPYDDGVPIWNSPYDAAKLFDDVCTGLKAPFVWFTVNVEVAASSFGVPDTVFHEVESVPLVPALSPARAVQLVDVTLSVPLTLEAARATPPGFDVAS